ncbi:MAG: hypothetical protein M3R57_09995 [Chloroflexota bacterium]|nr:hypothetical protein [Chloroflexota bacterium]
MSRSVRRLTVTAALAVVGSILAACAGGPVGRAFVDPGRVEPLPVANPSQPYGPYPTLPATGEQAPVGNTDRHYPELSVSRENGFAIDLVDPEAEAWWIVISGTGANAGDRLEIIAEVGDIWPGAAVHVYVGGELVDTTDMNGLIGNSTAIAGGCHPTLGLCYSSAGVDIRPEDGRLSVALEGAATNPFEIRGATAGWNGEPFILGPWRGTETGPAG